LYPAIRGLKVLSQRNIALLAWKAINFWTKRAAELFLDKTGLQWDIYLELEVILVGFWLKLMYSHFFKIDFTLDALFFAHGFVPKIKLGIRDTV
jgi:hypothetical protein